MQHLYIATVFAGALVCLLASLLLFARCKSGERSRIILAVIVSFSVYNYITRFIALCNGYVPEIVVSAKLLLQAIFMVICYVMYPIEVIAPGWLNIWRIVKLYSGWLFLLCVYLVSLWAGVQYRSYNSLLEMFAHADRFEVWFRLLLALLVFSPIFVVLFMHRTTLYRNADHVWIRKYILALFVNIFAYILVVMFNHPVFNIGYYYISVGCSLYIVYMELFDRLIGKSVEKRVAEEKQTQLEVAVEEDEEALLEKCAIEQRNAILIERLDAYMRKSRAWRNPDLSLNTLASELFTNRTTLSQAMRENGYENYTHYVGRLRIDDFLQQIESGQSDNFQEAFFFVGFRSRVTALRNFRQFVGMTPSEYFQRKETGMEEDAVE
jgi:AraC-like DNA-binding protein